MIIYEPGRSWRRIAAEALAWRGHGAARGAVHARTQTNTSSVNFLYIVASTPAMLVAAWSAGRQLHEQQMDGTRSMSPQAPVLPNLADGWLGNLLAGLAEVAPLILVAAAVSLFWAALFARIRGRSLDPAWLVTAWLYVLLLPTDLSLLLAALGMSFAAVFGQHAFGGCGRYIVSPALLGALFVQFSYPDSGSLSGAASWHAGVQIIDSAADVFSPDFAATMFASAALPTAIACLTGAAILGRAGILSLRLLAGALLGLVIATLLASVLSELPLAGLGWQWQLALGAMPVCLVFIITDPTTQAFSRGGRWLHGLLFGILVVTIRLLDPTHPDGSLFAALLATLAVPLMDFLVLRRIAARSGGQLVLRT